MSELDQNTNSNQEGGNHKGKCNDKFIGKSKSKGKGNNTIGDQNYNQVQNIQSDNINMNNQNQPKYKSILKNATSHNTHLKNKYESIESNIGTPRQNSNKLSQKSPSAR